MTETSFLIETLLKELGCTQTQLAEKLGVSRGQISKWKQGESMSKAKVDLVRSLLGWEEGVDPEGIRITGSLENYAKWKRCFYSIALDCREPEDYYSCNHKFVDLEEFWEGMYSETLRVLDEIGVRFPKEFPKSSVTENPICKLVYRIYEGSNLRGSFFDRFMYDICCHDKLDDHENYANLQWIHERIALCHLDHDDYVDVAPRLADFRAYWIPRIQKMVRDLKRAAIENHLPMSIEYSYLISAEDWQLEQILEIHDFNLYDVNDRHPDYYMQKLLDQTEDAYKKIDLLSRDIDELFALTKNNSKVYFNHSEADEPKYFPRFLQTWTGGPWSVEFPESSLADFNGGYSITVPRSEIVLEDESDDAQDEDGPKVVTLCKVEGAKALKSERIANVALIASAPELANTLIEILRNHESDGSKTHLCEQDQELVTALLTRIDQMIGQGRATLDQP